MERSGKVRDLQIFNHSEFGNIRMVIIEGKPYAVGIDVAKVLEYKKPSQAVIDHCKGIRKLGIPSKGGVQETNVIQEGDIYRLISKAADQSKNLQIKKKAEKFESWIYDEVLPTIRKHGLYATENTIEKIIGNPDFGIELLTQLKKERQEKQTLELTNKKQEQLIGELKPKADYTDKILKNKGLVTITQIAKDYGMTGQGMNALLHDLGVQYKQSEQWLLYVKYQGKGYTHSQTIDITRKDGTPDIKMNTKWTQKGRLFLYDLLKTNEILPVIERDT